MKHDKAIDVSNKLMELSKLGHANFKDVGFGSISKGKLEVDPPDALVFLGLCANRDEAIDYLRDVGDGFIIATGLGQIEPQKVIPQAITFGFILGAAMANRPKQPKA